MAINTFRYQVEVTPKNPEVRKGIVPCETLDEAKQLATSVRDGAQGYFYEKIIVWAQHTTDSAGDRFPVPVFVAKS